MHPKLICAAMVMAFALLGSPAVQATCMEICGLEVLAPTGCDRAEVVDGHALVGEGPLRVVAFTGSMCCAPPMEPDGDGSCSTETSAAAPALVGPSMGGAWQFEGECADRAVQRWSGALVGGTYRLDLPACDHIAMVDVDGAETDAAGCRAVPGVPAPSGLGLLTLGLLMLGPLRRRSRGAA